MKSRKLKRLYLKDLPSTTLNNSVEFKTNSQAVIDELKWMNVFHTPIPI